MAQTTKAVRKPSCFPQFGGHTMGAMQTDEPYIPPFIRRAMPSASEEELLQATSNLRRYLNIMYRLVRELEIEQARADSRQPTLDDRFQSRGEDPPSQ